MPALSIMEGVFLFPLILFFVVACLFVFALCYLLTLYFVRWFCTKAICVVNYLIEKMGDHTESVLVALNELDKEKEL